MGLLDQLRADTSGDHGKNDKWRALPDMLADAIDNYQHGKIVLVRGEVILIGSVRHASQPRHIYVVLHSERTAANPAESKNFSRHEQLPKPRPGHARPISMGMSRYKADSEANYYSDPWIDWVQPNPESVTEWIASIISNTTQDTPNMEARYRAKRS
jgi:hypothetical protein